MAYAILYTPLCIPKDQYKFIGVKAAHKMSGKGKDFEWEYFESHFENPNNENF